MECVKREQEMRMQAELCGLIVRDPLLLVATARNWPTRLKLNAHSVGFAGRLVMLVPEQALVGRSVHKAGSNG